MAKKSMVVAILLSFFLAAGGFYAAGLKKGLILFIGTCVVDWLLAQAAPSAAIVGNLIACFITYKWVQEHNNAVDGGGAEAYTIDK